MQNASELKTANPSAALSPDALRLKQQLKLLYKTQNTLPKLIEDSTIPEQNMDEYYVQLQMLLDNGAEKEDIKSSQLFDAVGKQAVPRKVLIIGKAGVGKTTFLHHLSYDWATERSFSEKYDYVFKVKLKLLLNKGKESNFYDVNHGQRLAKLIHMSIDDQQGELRTKFREAANKMQPFLEDKDVALSRLDIASIIEALGSARTLLLLDGYDELAVSKEMSEEILNLMAEIKRYDIVMTSRPNALAVNDQKDFDRLIEATGLNKEGALTYIETYFSKKEALTQVFFKDFIEKANIFKTAEEEQSNTELDIQIKRQAKAISDKGNREALGLIRKVIADLNQAEEQEEKESSRKSAALVKTLTKEVIIGRISRYYGDIKESLGNLLRMNPSLEEMITTPINTAMLCLISDNTKALKRLEKDINAGVLYQESILWLAKRYVQKRADLEPLSARVKISAFEKAEDSFMLTEMKVLKDLAYSEFIKGNVIIKGAAIESIAREQFGSMGKIDQVNEFGLLKPETFGSSTNNKDESEEESEIDELNEIDAQDLKKIDHSFIHLSFQEYLSAYFLKEQLASETQELAQKAALFIARHRSEPRYLMTLKFLSGIVTNDPSEKARLVQLRFLDAISCNIDGLIELGMEKKVILLMHIMAQVNESLLLSPAAGGTANLAKQEELKEKIQTKIQGIKDFIDIEILKDLSKWSNAVIASHYLSDKIINQVKLMIEGGGREAEIKKLSHNNEPVKPSENQEDEGLVIQVRNQQLESAIEIMSNFSYKKEFESKKAIYNKFLRLYQCNTKNWPLQKNILSKLSLLLDYANQQDNITQTLDIILGGDVVSSTPLDFIPFKERASSKSSYYGLIDEGLIKWGSSRSLDFILINDGLIKEGVSQPSLFNQDMSQESQELLYHIIKQEADAAKKTSSVFSPFDSNNSDIPVLVSRVLTFLIHILFNENINYETRDRALDILIEITLIDRKYMVVFVTDFGKEYNSFLQSESHGATLAFAEKIIKINSELEVGSVSMVDEWMNSGLGDLAFGALNLALTVIEKNPDFALDFVSIVYKGINFGSNMLKSMALKLAI